MPAPPTRNRQLGMSIDRSSPKYQFWVMFSVLSTSARELGYACSRCSRAKDSELGFIEATGANQPSDVETANTSITDRENAYGGYPCFQCWPGVSDKWCACLG